MLATVLVLVLPGTAAAAPPVNDDFANATALTPPAGGATTSVDGTTTGATGQTGEPNPTGNAWSCGNATCARSVWYTITPTASGLLTLDTCDATVQPDTVVGVYTGSAVGSLTEVKASDDGFSCPGNDFSSQVTIDAQAGTTYRIYVSGFEANPVDFKLRAFNGLGPPGVAPFFPTPVNSQTTELFYELLTPIAGASLSCSVDGGPATACADSLELDGESFTDGSTHSVAATATAAGQTSQPTTQQFTVDLSPPDTTITSGPAEGDSTTVPIDWGVATSEEGVVDCEIDGAFIIFSGCNSGGPAATPRTISVNTALCESSHEFKFTARDGVGNQDSTPAARNVVVTGGGPCAKPDLGPPQALGSGPTAQAIVSNLDTHRAGTAGHLEWGPTTAYGQVLPEVSFGLDSQAADTLNFLDPETTYHARFIAHNPSGAATSEDLQFTTGPAFGDPPSAALGAPSVIGRTAATLHGTVTSTQEYRWSFEYGTTAAYGSLTPAFREDAAPGGIIHDFRISGLSPDTTYHYRMLVASDGGTFRTPDATFKTAGGSTPPGGSPGDTGGTPPAGGSSGGLTPIFGTPQLPDTRGPGFKAGGLTTKLSRSGSVSFFLTPDEDATGTATGAVSVPSNASRSLRFKTARLKLKRGVKSKVTLKLSKNNAAKVRRALRHKRLKAKVTITLIDTSRNKSAKTLTLKLKR
jgi:hypothetical protein